MSAMIDLGIPARGLAFIKHIETLESYGNSPIIVTPKTRDAIAKCQFMVVGLGDYEYCEDPDECERWHFTLSGVKHEQRYHRKDLMVGDWILARNRAWDVTPDPSVFVIRQSDVLGKFVET